MKRDHDDIGSLPRGLHIGADMVFVTKRRPRGAGTRPEGLRKRQRVGEHRHGLIADADKRRLPRLLQVHACTRMFDAHGRQCRERVLQTFDAIVHGVVVGQRDNIEPRRGQGRPHLARGRAKYVAFIALWVACVCEWALEVSENHIGIAQHAAHIGKRMIVAEFGHLGGRAAAQHDVTDSDDAQPPGGGFLRYRQRLWRRRLAGRLGHGGHTHGRGGR